MILCLDVGNSQIFAGVFEKDEIKLRFRHATQKGNTSDQLGVFLKATLRENKIDPDVIKKIAICSVVPSIDYSLRAACLKYFNIEPFILQAGVKTGLKIKYHNPLEVGADRVANAMAATHQFPQENLIVIDLGTATTFCAISAKKEYLGGVILPGIRLAMESLQNNAAKLFSVEIITPEATLGRSTATSIQSGLYYGQLGAMREVVKNLTQEAFHGEIPKVLGTGGFAHLFENEKIFSVIMPDLVLDGLRVALKINS